MARARSERSRSKTAVIDDLTQSIEQLQAFLPQVEDLGREGFPYLEGARARTELQLRECIKRTFGEKSQEYQTHRHHRLSFGSPAETKQTITLIKTLIATLEDKKLELQGLKPSPPEEPSTAPPPGPSARPQMTLVPPTTPTATVTIATAPVTPPPITVSVPLATNVEMTASASAPSTASPTAQATPALPTEPVVPQPPAAVPTAPSAAQPVVSAPPATFLRTQETQPLTAPAPQALQPAPPSSPAPRANPVSEPAPPAPVPAAAPSPAPQTAAVSPTTHERAPFQEPVPPESPRPTASPAATPPSFFITQEVPVKQPAPSDTASTNPVDALSGPSTVAPDHLDLTRNLCQRFHTVARQLRLRGEYRATLAVEDEIDVQDLLHALLRLQFDDIGTDEWIPAYADGALRTTFLLDHDRLAVTVKKTRPGLGAKDLAGQVRVDTERYRAREGCAHLFCFIYDPEGRIGNPRGLERDLTAVHDGLSVTTLVAPK